MLEAKTVGHICEKGFSKFHSLQKHKKFEHGKLTRIQNLIEDMKPIMVDYHDQELRKELTACNTFCWTLSSSEVDSTFSILHQLVSLLVS